MVAVLFSVYFQLENKNIAQELSDLVVYCQPMGVQAFEVARETGPTIYLSRIVFFFTQLLRMRAT